MVDEYYRPKIRTQCVFDNIQTTKLSRTVINSDKMKIQPVHKHQQTKNINAVSIKNIYKNSCYLNIKHRSNKFYHNNHKHYNNHNKIKNCNYAYYIKN